MRNRIPRKQKKRIKGLVTGKGQYFTKYYIKMLLRIIANTNMAYAYDPNWRPAIDPHRRTWKLINLANHYGATPQALYNSWLKSFAAFHNPALGKPFN
jgi:hypothetical protein